MGTGMDKKVFEIILIVLFIVSIANLIYQCLR